MQEENKEIMKQIFNNLKILGVFISKIFFSFSFIFVFVFFAYNPLLTIIFSLVLFIGFLKTKHYRYITWEK